MNIPADVLEVLAEDSEFFDTVGGYAGDTVHSGGLDVEKTVVRAVSSAEAVGHLSPTDQLVAMEYYAQKKLTLEQRCISLHKMGLPCYDLMRELFMQRCTDGVYMTPVEDFPTPDALLDTPFTDSPWGKWFVHWCMGELCTTVSSLMARMDVTAHQYLSVSIRKMLHSGDLVRAERAMGRAGEYTTRRMMISPMHSLKKGMTEEMMRGVIAFLLKHVDVYDAKLYMGFWGDLDQLLWGDERFMDLLADRPDTSHLRCLAISVSNLQPRLMRRAIQKCLSDTCLPPQDIIREIVEEFILAHTVRKGRMNPRVAQYVAPVLDVILELIPVVVSRLMKIPGAHQTSVFNSWVMHNRTAMMHGLGVTAHAAEMFYLNGRLRACESPADNLELEQRYTAAVGDVSIFEGLIAYHHRMALVPPGEYRVIRKKGLGGRRADVPPHPFWTRPATTAEKKYLQKIFGVGRFMDLYDIWHSDTIEGRLSRPLNMELEYGEILPDRITAVLLLYVNVPGGKVSAMNLMSLVISMHLQYLVAWPEPHLMTLHRRCKSLWINGW